MPRSHMLITGMGRSGTTLLDKLLTAHPQCHFYSQPLPLLFVEVKRRFLELHGLKPDPYPLASYYRCGYSIHDFTRWLESYRVEESVIDSAESLMADYSGQLDKLQLSVDLAGMPLADLLSTCLEHTSSTQHIVGLKEVFCEEFLPYLLKSGFAAAIILRDPRDVVASMHHGDGPHHIGSPRPILFDLRNWRKSVEFCIHLGGKANFTYLRYEDLVRSPATSLNSVFSQLGLHGVTSDGLQMKDGDGNDWQGNSSFGQFAAAGISRNSVGRYAEVLGPDQIQYVESICLAEMHWAGYVASRRSDSAYMASIANPRPDVCHRAEFAHGYSTSFDNTDFEQRRLAALIDGDMSRADEICVFSDNFPTLSSQLQTA